VCREGSAIVEPDRTVRNDIVPDAVAGSRPIARADAQSDARANS